MTKRKKKIKKHSRLSDVAALKFIKDFSLFIKQGYRIIVLSVDQMKESESKNPKVARTKNRRIMLRSNVQCVIVKSRN